MALFISKKKRLLEWQNTILSDPHDKLIMSEKQLQQTSDQQAQNSLRIIQDSTKLISETKNPEVFFSRYSLLIQHSQFLLKLETYVNFAGASLSAAYQEVIDNKQVAIKEFLI